MVVLGFIYEKQFVFIFKILFYMPLVYLFDFSFHFILFLVCTYLQLGCLIWWICMLFHDPFLCIFDNSLLLAHWSMYAALKGCLALLFYSLYYCGKIYTCHRMLFPSKIGKTYGSLYLTPIVLFSQPWYKAFLELFAIARLICKRTCHLAHPLKIWEARYVLCWKRLFVEFYYFSNLKGISICYN